MVRGGGFEASALRGLPRFFWAGTASGGSLGVLLVAMGTTSSAGMGNLLLLAFGLVDDGAVTSVLDLGILAVLVTGASLSIGPLGIAISVAFFFGLPICCPIDLRFFLLGLGLFHDPVTFVTDVTP